MVAIRSGTSTHKLRYVQDFYRLGGSWRITMEPHHCWLRPTICDPRPNSELAFAAAIRYAAFAITASTLRHSIAGNAKLLHLFPEPVSLIKELYVSVIPRPRRQETAASSRHVFEPHITLVKSAAGKPLGKKSHRRAKETIFRSAGFNTEQSHCTRSVQG